MGVFKYGNSFIRILTKIANLILVSLYWVLSCIPVITIVTSSSALYYTVNKVVNGSGDGVTKAFFMAIKENFKKGVLLFLIAAGSGAILFFDLYFGYMNYTKNVFAMVYFFIGIPLGFIWLSMAVYLPVVFSRFDGTVGVILRLTAYFASRNILSTLLRIVFLGLIVFLVDYYPVLLLVLPGVYTDLFRNGHEKMMNKYLSENGYKEPEKASERDEEAPAELTPLEMDELFKK
ncbi:MAG: YesL family protein [Lachnospiraceae bacterium]|nr:YesL family protein [Lachnospiraceae bacterium]